jgi:type IV secretory pathway TrbD component
MNRIMMVVGTVLIVLAVLRVWTLRNEEQDELVDMGMGAYREVRSLQGLAAIVLVIGVTILPAGL